MKRGLVVLDLEAIPASEWRDRIEAVQVRTRALGAEVALVYGDAYRSDDIAFLTNLTVYWNEAVLAIPSSGETALMTKLSGRVHEWMQATSTLRDLRSGPNLVRLIAAYLEERSHAGRIALADQRWWPASIADGIAEIAECVDAPDLVRGLRLVPRGAERRELARVAAVAAEAVAAAMAGDHPDAGRVAVVERYARNKGAKDVLVSCDRLADGTVTVDALVQAGTVWARTARVAGPSAAGPAVASLGAGLVAATDALVPGATVADVCATANAAWADVDGSHCLRVIQHADLATRGDLRPTSETALQLPAGTVVGVVAEWFGDGRAALAGMYEVATGGGRKLDHTLEASP